MFAHDFTSNDSSRTRQFSLLLVALLAALALAGWQAGHASALVQTAATGCGLGGGSTFQGGDGDQVVASTPACPSQSGLQDWADRLNDTGAGSADPNASDDIFFAGSKETEPDNWVFHSQNNGASPPKDNFLFAWRLADPTNSNQPSFLNLAFRREYSGSGTKQDTYLAFELNQSQATWGPNSKGTTNVPCRSNGDVLVSYEVHPPSHAASPYVQFRVYRWRGTGDGPANCPNGKTGFNGAGPDGLTYTNGLGEVAVTSSDIQGWVNFDSPFGPGELDSVLSNGGSNPFQSGVFAETSIRLASVFPVPSGLCSPWGRIQLQSRSSDAVTSALQDKMTVQPIVDASCSNTPNNPNNPNNPNGTNPNGTPGSSVLASRVVSGLARLRGPRGCAARVSHAYVSGRQISRVTFYLDGKKIRTVTRPDKHGRYGVRVTARRFGVHRLVAKITFRRDSRTKAKTLRLTFNRCPPAVLRPAFTG